MGILDYFRSTRKSNSASMAKERLQIIVAHQHSGGGGGQADYLPQLKEDLLKVINKYVNISADQVQVQLDTDDKNCQVLELNVTLPDQVIKV